MATPSSGGGEKHPHQGEVGNTLIREVGGWQHPHQGGGRMATPSSGGGEKHPHQTHVHLDTV